MDRILKKARVPNTVCALIPEDFGICASCRAWSRPPPAGVTRVELADTYNQQVEADLMLAYHCRIFRLIDRGTRWHTACLVQSKEVRALLEALDFIRVGAHDQIKELSIDEETGLAATDSAKQYHDQHGIKVMPRAK